jgi:hypothetical protein
MVERLRRHITEVSAMARQMSSVQPASQGPSTDPQRQG